MRALFLIGFVGLMTVAFAPQLRADNLGQIVHAITDPAEAHRYELRAHEQGRPDEERYWHQYGEGLRQQHDHH
jgi:hypothetical protein